MSTNQAHTRGRPLWGGTPAAPSRRGLAKSARSNPVAAAQQLLDLAEQLRLVLVPVEADANYRRRLKGELILAAQQRPQAEAEPPSRRRRLILLAAAGVGSLASVAGVIIALVIRSRHGRAQISPLSPLGRG